MNIARTDIAILYPLSCRNLVEVKAQAERVADQLVKLQDRDRKLTAELADAREQFAVLRG